MTAQFSKPRLVALIIFSLMFGILVGLDKMGITQTQNWILAKQLTSATPPERYKIVKKLSELNPAQATLKIIADSGLARDGELHLLTHIVGETLYRQKGIYALSECFGDELYGCTHGLIIAGMTNEGFEPIKQTIDDCQEESVFQYHMCLHAAGHGFMAYTKYELLPALHYCDLLEAETYAIQHCYNGVFMENVHGSHDGQSPLTHPSLSRENPLAPCDRVDEKYKSACYLNQVGWWLYFEGNNYQSVGTMCLDVPTEYQVECANNYGRILSTALVNDVAAISKHCQLFDPRLARECLSAVATSLWGMGGYSQADQFCQANQDYETISYCLNQLEKLKSEQQ